MVDPLYLRYNKIDLIFQKYKINYLNLEASHEE